MKWVHFLSYKKSENIPMNMKQEDLITHQKVMSSEHVPIHALFSSGEKVQLILSCL
jgi:hypothetical protein